jgi:hypothetical protein
MPRKMKYPDFIREGAEFGRLVVLGDAFRAQVSVKTNWYCVTRCKCGSPPEVVFVGSILSGATKSCGCIRKESTGRLKRTHGGSKDPLYGVWVDMKRRCQDDTRKQWKDYGGRGINVDSRWDDYAVFREWSLSNGYKQGLEIDRKNNDGPYSPENCHWVTQLENLRNTRKNLILEAFGESKPMSMWAEDPRCQVAYTTLRARVRNGWNHADAITREARPKMDGSLR